MQHTKCAGNPGGAVKEEENSYLTPPKTTTTNISGLDLTLVNNPVRTWLTQKQKKKKQKKKKKKKEIRPAKELPVREVTKLYTRLAKELPVQKP